MLLLLVLETFKLYALSPFFVASDPKLMELLYRHFTRWGVYAGVDLGFLKGGGGE